jgi:glutamate N-acetyltransferase/amino-acid N-acetyltransferase
MFEILPLNGSLELIEDIYCDGISAQLKPNNQLDIGFIYTKKPCNISTVFTNNKFKAAPLKHYLLKKEFKTNFILINSKNANAMTNQAGIDDIDEIFEQLSKKFNLINPIMSSTGVIGVRLPKSKIIQGALQFNLETKNGDNLSKAIMTTDSYPKTISVKVILDNNESFIISAIAKGAGMINPSLATMLCFIVTDANIPKQDMDELLHLNIQTTFNAISVDGDTSTNDTVMLLATKTKSYNKEAFSEALRVVMEKLAIDIISDGEGASKSVAFEVSGAKNNNEAQKCAKALSNSLLVKTALFGEDPNWGRIASTIGSSGVECNEDKLIIKFGDILVYDKGEIYFDNTNEQEASKLMQQNSFKISCDLGMGSGKFIAYGCDLGYEYVKINADYRT